MAHFALHGALLLAGAGALAAFGWRVAGKLGAQGNEALLAAFTCAAAAAALSALGLGLVGLGGSPWALVAIALAACAAVRGLKWAPPAGPLAAAAGREPASPGGRDGRHGGLSSRPAIPLAAAAAGGVGVAWIVWLGRYPALGIDPLTYHLSESVIWAQEGSPGSVEEVMYEFSTGRYPVTNEVLVSWLVATGRSLAPALVWTPLMGALFALAGWSALRRLGATAVAAGLAVAAVLAIPIAATQHLGPHTDMPAIAWLATCVALSLARLPAPALLAAALAVGTKTTVAPLALVFVLLSLRGSVAWRPLALAAAVGAAVGGTWYLRNWIEVGSPFWPFAGGDPRPDIYDRIDATFLERVSFSLADGRAGVYVDILGGAPLVLAAGVLAWVLSRRREVVFASAAAAVLALAWANAPFTGRADDPVIDVSLTTVRYLFAAIAVAAAALALTRNRIATAVLSAAVMFSLAKALQLDFPATPGIGVLLAGAVLGPLAFRAPWPLWAAGALAFLVLAGDGLTQRHADSAFLPSSGVLAFLDRQPGAEPVAFAPATLSVAAGDDLRRDISLIARDESCDRVLARLDEGWVVIGSSSFADRLVAFTADDCLRGEQPAFRSESWSAYAPR